MREFTKRLAAVLALLALTALPAMAQGRGPHGPGPHGSGPGGPDGPGGPGMIEHMTQELGLSAEQQDRVRAIFAKYRDGALRTARMAMRDARGRLGDTIHDPDATDAQVQEAVSAVSTLEAQLAAEQHHMALEVNAVLSPEQRAKFAQLRHAHRTRAGGPPPPPPPGGEF